MSADLFDMDGFIGGFHAGYLWQDGSFVYGVEGDIDYANISGGSNFNYGGFTGHLGLKSDWQGSLRVRGGIAADNWLLYGTAGLAIGHAELTAAGGGTSASNDNIHVGWTVGVGVEKAFTPNLVGRLEARYSDFGSQKYDLGGFGKDIESSLTQTVFSAGLSYKF